MRNLIPQILIGLLLVVLMSCDEEADLATSVQPAVVQFQHEQQTLPEDDNQGVMVTLLLDRAVTSAGTITVKIEETMHDRIQTDPAHDDGVLVLPVNKGA